MLQEKPFDEWLAENMPKIRQMIAFSQERMSDQPAELANQMSQACAYQARAGYLLADAKSYLTHERARHMSQIAKDLSELSVPEKKIILEDKTRDIQRLFDQLEVVCKSLSEMTYACMNLRRSQARETPVYAEG